MRRQSDHFATYAGALEKLRGQGLVYPCFCTRKEIAAEIAASAAAPHGPDGPLYPGTCRKLNEEERRLRIAGGASHAWRLDVERAMPTEPIVFEESGEGPGGECGSIVARPEILGDAVLARSETPASYHLSVVLDDAAQGITVVTRGNDLFPATHLHRLLQHLFQLRTPRYRHHRLITNAAGARLAKRDHATALKTLREGGMTAAEIRNRLGFTNR